MEFMKESKYYAKFHTSRGMDVIAPSGSVGEQKISLDQKIILCGLGGQGILFMARVLYEVGRLLGCQVLGSETHGMSQRGGSVTSHIKIGDYHSPMVRSGTADILFALKAEEVYSNLHFLRRGGKILLNAPESYSLVSSVTHALKDKEILTVKKDATGCAIKLGNPLAANLVLLSAGIKTGVLPLKNGILEEAVKRVSPPRLREGSLKAIEAGSEL